MEHKTNSKEFDNIQELKNKIMREKEKRKKAKQLEALKGKFAGNLLRTLKGPNININS